MKINRIILGLTTGTSESFEFFLSSFYLLIFERRTSMKLTNKQIRTRRIRMRAVATVFHLNVLNNRFKIFNNVKNRIMYQDLAIHNKVYWGIEVLGKENTYNINSSCPVTIYVGLMGRESIYNMIVPVQSLFTWDVMGRKNIYSIISSCLTTICIGVNG